jgi:SAM-dependent methyltransferase
MRASRDAFGRALLDWARGETTPEMIERDDGYWEMGAGPDVYLAGVKQWPSAERQSLRYVRGRVLDIGCGAGRVSLHLQQKGFEVVGLDSSPLAVQAARHRGVNHVRCAPFEKLGPKIGLFDTIVLFGNNFGLFETPERAHVILCEWAMRTKPGTRILCESTAAFSGGAPGFDRKYYQRNVEQGCAPGQLRLRYHYDGVATEWFSWLFVSRREMNQILRGTGWRYLEVLGNRPSEPYVAILEKS